MPTSAELAKPENGTAWKNVQVRVTDFTSLNKYFMNTYGVTLTPLNEVLHLSGETSRRERTTIYQLWLNEKPVTEGYGLQYLEVPHDLNVFAKVN